MARVKARKADGEDYGPKIEARVWRCCTPGIGLPLLLILIGIWIIGKDLGWWESSINIWGVILVIMGAYWLLKAVLYNR